MTSLCDHILSTFDQALREEWIQVYYQPVIRTLSRQLCSVEALARWIDPDLGMLNPEQFIGVLEEHRLIHRLDICVVRQVCRQIRSILNRDSLAVPMSVNLSRLDFELCDIFAEVEKATEEYAVPHEYICIEITESVLQNNEERMHAAIRQFRKAGFQVWMDDFGSGYSTLNVLKDYEFDELKVDMQFIAELHLRSRKILTSIIQMAKDIDIQTLVEGVETEEQFEFLQTVGCEKVQGYLFGRPTPFEDMIRHLREIGVTVEQARERHYYDLIGHTNVLSSNPFLGTEERDSLLSARQLSSISLAIGEKRGDVFSLLYHNSAFEDIARTLAFGQKIFEAGGKCLPVSMLPTRFRILLEEIRQTGDGRMTFVSEGDYFELHVKRIAQSGPAFSVLLQLDNISSMSRAAQTNVMDSVAREFYTLFERVTLLDLKTNRVTPLYMGGRERSVSTMERPKDYLTEYALEAIFPESRADFLRFMDTDTMEDRLMQSEDRALGGNFLTYTDGGRYRWKKYILHLIHPGRVLAMSRDISREMREREAAGAIEAAAAPVQDESLPERLWRNLVQSDALNLFWKDTQRRFRGASRGFLNFYGFASQEEILGKTDEDLGWHADPAPFMSDEFRVLREGHTVRNAAGRCLANGETRHITVNKLPVYDTDGRITGLLGSFTVHRELGEENDPRYRDPLTGLLNEVGLRQEIYNLVDAYDRRKVDFVRVHAAIDDFNHLITQYGYDHGDKLIAALGDALKRNFGANSAIGRLGGSTFALLTQYTKKEALMRLQVAIKNLSSQLREVDGITVYLSVGMAPYSEAGDAGGQGHLADTRMRADHSESTPVAYQVALSTETFRMYDYLPVDYAVYRVITDRDHIVRDATLLFANQKWLDRSSKRLDEVKGRSVREMFPNLDETWFQLAHRAALLGEEVTERVYVPSMNNYFHCTVNQVVRPGYCAFTYLLVDETGQGMEASTKGFLPIEQTD